MDGVWVPCACAVCVYVNVCAVVCCVVSLCVVSLVVCCVLCSWLCINITKLTCPKVIVFSMNCPQCQSPCETRMKSVGIY